MYVVTRYVYAGPIHNVAFYDRASTKKQSTNYIRSFYCDIALAAAKELGFNIVRSNDTRNGGVCFLDVGTGIRFDNRPQLQRILSNDVIDTVAILEFDRLCRGVDVCTCIRKMVDDAGKNLVHVQTVEDHLRDMEFEYQIENMLRDVYV